MEEDEILNMGETRKYLNRSSSTLRRLEATKQLLPCGRHITTQERLYRLSDLKIYKHSLIKFN